MARREEQSLTLIIAAHGKDFLVVGADSRETVDAGVVRVEVNQAEKLIQVSKHNVILVSGAAGHASYLVLKYQMNNVGRKKEIGVTDLAKEYAISCQEEATRLDKVPTYSRNPPYTYFPNIGYVVAGFEKEGDKFTIPRAYTLSSYHGYMLELGGGFVLDGKPMIARYLFSKKYKRGMDVDSLTKLVALALADTADADGDVGKPFHMAVIDAPDGVRFKTEDEIDEMIEEANEEKGD